VCPPKVIPGDILVPSAAVDCECSANQAGIDDDLPEIMDYCVALGAIYSRQNRHRRGSPASPSVIIAISNYLLLTR